MSYYRRQRHPLGWEVPWDDLEELFPKSTPPTPPPSSPTGPSMTTKDVANVLDSMVPTPPKKKFPLVPVILIVGLGLLVFGSKR